MDRKIAALVKTSVKGMPDPDDVDIERAANPAGSWKTLSAEKTVYPGGTVLVEVTVPAGVQGFLRAVVR